jgi:hypothetical protein
MDTSALVQFYIDQSGTEKVQDLMENADEIIISPITKLESLRTFRRLREDKAIDGNEYIVIKELFLDHLSDFTILTLDSSLEYIAEELIEKYSLKTLDSIQLASAVKEKDKIELFVSSDKRLLKAVGRENIGTFNPGDTNKG